jgi:hypothetical protein
MDLSSEQATPEGFSCAPAAGARHCTWNGVADAGLILFDAPALEAACAATTAYPTLTLSCRIHGS